MKRRSATLCCLAGGDVAAADGRWRAGGAFAIMVQWLSCRRAWCGPAHRHSGSLPKLRGAKRPEARRVASPPGGCEPPWHAVRRQCPPSPVGEGAPPGAPLRHLSDRGHAFSLESCPSRVSQLLAGDLSYPRVELPGPPGRSVWDCERGRLCPACKAPLESAPHGQRTRT